MTTAEKIKVMQAYEGGSEIEMRSHEFLQESSWSYCPDPNWHFSVLDYRIREQKYKELTIDEAYRKLVSAGDFECECKRETGGWSNQILDSVCPNAPRPFGTNDDVWYRHCRIKV